MEKPSSKNIFKIVMSPRGWKVITTNGTKVCITEILDRVNPKASYESRDALRHALIKELISKDANALFVYEDVPDKNVPSVMWGKKRKVTPIGELLEDWK